jgi:eukaryotic-like serine/threonine-protein kinase
MAPLAGDSNPAPADDAPLVSPQPRDSRRYRLLAEHGRGGLGRVYRAHDRELGRDVALKELLQHRLRSEARFFREVYITARLRHPGIAPVHEAAVRPTDSYSMKLVAGRPLSELRSEAKTHDACLALLPHLIAVADAIAYAHDRQTIHRDLKPFNEARPAHQDGVRVAVLAAIEIGEFPWLRASET